MSNKDTEEIDLQDVAFLQIAAEFLGVSRQTIHTWRKEGILPEYRFGPTKRVCFKWDDLRAYKAFRVTQQSNEGK
jgi:excisionase family DNA binding protein